MGKGFGLLVVLALLVGVGWILLGGDVEVSGGQVGPGVVVETLSERELGAATLDSELVVDVGERVEAEREAVVELPVARALEIAAAPVGGVEMLVVNKETGRPVAGALVRQVEAHERGMRGWFHQLVTMPAGRSPAIFEGSPVYQSDERGRVVVGDLMNGSLVRANFDGRVGFAGLGVSFAKGNVIELVEDRSLVVRVEDTEGKRLERERIQLMRAEGWGMGSGLTDQQGEVRLSRVLSFLPVAMGGLQRLWVMVDGQSGEGMGTLLDLENLPSGPLVIQLDSGREVRVQVTDLAGKPVEAGLGQVQLNFDSDDPWGGMRSRDVDGAGLAEFSGLPAGVEMRASFWIGGKPLAESAVVGLTPLAPGGVLELAMAVRTDVEFDFRARLLDLDGKPLANSTVQVEQSKRLLSSSSSNLGEEQTDDDGWLSWNLNGSGSVFGKAGAGGLDEGEQLKMMIRVGSGKTGLEQNLDPLFGPLLGTVDFGDLQLEASPLLVAGRVQDDEGVGLPGTIIWVLASDDQKHLDDGIGSMVSVGNETNASGDFEIYGGAQEAFLGVQIMTAEGYRGGVVRFERGADDCVITVGQKSSVMGSLSLPDGVNGISATFGIQPVEPIEGFSPRALTSSTTTGGGWWDAPVTNTGQFGWKWLDPGLYNTRLSFGRREEPAVEWGLVLVEAGQTTRDPRMQNVDVSAYLNLVELSIRDSQGQDIAGAKYRLEREPSFRATLAPAGGGLIVAPVGAKLVFTAAGFIGASEVVQDGRMDIVLVKAPKVTLVFPAGLSWTDGTDLVLYLSGEHGDSNTVVVRQSRATLFAPALGELRVQLGARTTSGNSSSTSFGGGGKVVVNITGPGEVQVDLDQATLDLFMNN